MHIASPPDLGLCSVAMLADEAAALTKILRIIREARDAAQEGAPALTLDDLFKSIGWTVQGPVQLLPKDFTRECLSRLRAIAAVAPHRQAASLKGVAFQALLASHRAGDLFADPFPTDGPGADAALCLVAGIDRCVASILSQLALRGGALPPDLLAFYGMGEGEQPSRMVQLILDLPIAA